MGSPDTLSQGLADGENGLDLSERSLFLAGADGRTKRYWRDIDHAAMEQLERRRRSGETIPVSVDKGRKAGVFKGPRDERYSASLTFCNCPDFIKRRRPCEHMYRLANELELLASPLKTPRRDAVPAPDVVHHENSENAPRQAKTEYGAIQEEIWSSENHSSFSFGSLLIVMVAIVSMIIGIDGAIRSFGASPENGGSGEKPSTRSASSQPGSSSPPSPAKTTKEQREQGKNAADAMKKTNEKANPPRSPAPPDQTSPRSGDSASSTERASAAQESRPRQPAQAKAPEKPADPLTAKTSEVAPKKTSASEDANATPAPARSRPETEKRSHTSPASPSSPPPQQPPRRSETGVSTGISVADDVLRDLIELDGPQETR